MNIQTHAIKTADDFLRWNEGREGKREFVRGRVVEMMTGGTRRHAEIALQLAMLLKSSELGKACVVTIADYAVRTPFGVRYPDVLLGRADADTGSLATDRPIFIAEVLSVSSMAVDFGDKAQEYRQVDTLAHYLVLSQDEPRVWLYSRGEGGNFTRQPEMIAGIEEMVPLGGLGITLALAEIYRGVAA